MKNYKKGKLRKICECGNEFYVWHSRSYTKFCSKKCRNKNRSETYKGRSTKWLIGSIPHNKGKTKDNYEPLKVVSQKMKDNENCIGYSGADNPMYGKPAPWTTKRNREMRGDRAPNWRGGINKDPYPFNFDEELKEIIRERDGRKCKKCGCPEIENGRKLTVHHIDYDKKNCEESNLVTLCVRCNSEVNFSRDDWEKYFKRLMTEAMKHGHLEFS